MKKSIVALGIIVIVFISSLFMANYTFAFCSDMKTDISLCTNAIKDENWDEAEKHIESAINTINKKEKILESFVSHQSFDEIKSLVFRVQAAVMQKNKEISIIEAAYLLARLELISTSDALTMSNVF